MSEPRRAPRAAMALAGPALAVAVSLTGCSSVPSPVGNPDPAHLRLDALRPVAQALPAGVQIVNRTIAEPKWDSCDGVSSTYGWDPVTVDVQFHTNGLPVDTIVDHVKARLRSQGWSYVASESGGGAWRWIRVLSGNVTATAQLLGAVGEDFDLQANAEPATHPVKGC